MTTHIPRLLSRNETAARLHVSPRTVTRRAQAGELPHVANGGLLQFWEDDVDAYLRERYRAKREKRVPAPAPVVRRPVDLEPNLAAIRPNPRTK